MRHFRRGSAVAVCLALVAGACGDDDDSSEAEGTGTGDPVTITWWHNANQEPGRSFWEEVAGEYMEDNPNVSIDISAVQNEELRDEIPIALQGNDPPDLFQQWGGGEMRDQVEAGKLMDITEAVAPWIDELGPSAANWQVDGVQYGLPYTVGVVGFWYNQDLFDEAGITEPPETWDDLLDAIDALKAADITPIALGGQDRWPDRFYWEYVAVRTCSQEVIEQSVADYSFDDPCWVEAGEILAELIDAEPFNEGFLATPAQQGSASSAGLMGNGNAAMELQGHWNLNQMEVLSESGEGIGDALGWFPFPALSDGDDDVGAIGGGDGFSCSQPAPPECADFLSYLLSADVQERWAALDVGPPVREGSEGAVEAPTMQTLMEYRDAAPFVQTYLDIAYTTSVGEALNEAVAEQFADALSPEGVVDAVQDAAESR
jgi:raffinose/stachyose/melibiose transport system substrate-binding protein